jgi:protein-S-isoprenylcysteine O-methyltransferase Ste14
MTLATDRSEEMLDNPRLSTRLAWLAVNLFLGLAPTLLFFAWVEQDAALPAVGRWLGWPWLDPGIGPAPGRLLWDFGLFAAFGFLHSFFAQVGVQARVQAMVPAPAMRSFFLAVTGTALLLMMGLWQPTGLIVWRLPIPARAEAAIAAIVFAVPAAVILRLLVRLGFFEFLGWAQLFGPAQASTRTAGTPMLRTNGIYGFVRHPVYTGLLAMFLLGPTLSLDRLALFLAALGYLSVGIPVEERKLIRLFGDDYVEYRRHVPALLPIGFVGAGRSASAGPPGPARDETIPTTTPR